LRWAGGAAWKFKLGNSAPDEKGETFNQVVAGSKTIENPVRPIMINQKMKKFDSKKHSLVPKHTKISEREKEEIYKRYKLSSDRLLPGILKTDPAIASLNVKDGDVIKVIRESPTAGEAIFYRVVRNA